MKMTIDAKLLAGALTRANLFNERRTSIPILSNVLLSSDGVRMMATVTATNLDTIFAEEVPCMVAAEGDITANGADLLAAVKAAGGALEVELVGEGKAATLKVGNMTLATLPAADFPRDPFKLPEGDGKGFSLPAARWLDMQDKVAFAVSTEETRYYLNGICVHNCDGALAFAATDGHRMTRLVLPDVAASMLDRGVGGGFIVPRILCGQLAKLLKGDKGRFVFAFHKSDKGSQFITCDAGHWRIRAKCIDGIFPDITRVIPSRLGRGDKGVALTVDAAALAAVVKRVQVPKDRVTRVKIDLDAMTVSASSPEGWSACEAFGGVAVTDVGGAFGVNARYLVEALARFEGDIELTLKDAAAPMRFDGNVKDYVSVLMPIRL